MSTALTTPEKQKSNEWYTPARYVEAAREVMGSIDLDPASCAMANQIIKATRYYTKEDDGLSKKWHGNVWLNPPYGKVDNKSIIKAFVYKLIHEYEASHISQAVLLAIVRTDSPWFQLLWDYPVCFSNHIVHFYKPINGKVIKDSKNGHFFGTVFVYLGPNEQRFIDTFSQFGTIAKRVSQPRHVAATPSLWEVSA